MKTTWQLGEIPEYFHFVEQSLLREIPFNLTDFVWKALRGETCPGYCTWVSNGHAYPAYTRTGLMQLGTARCPHFACSWEHKPFTPQNHPSSQKLNSHQARVNSKGEFIFWILFYCLIPLCPSRAKTATPTHDIYYVQGIAATTTLAVG